MTMNPAGATANLEVLQLNYRISNGTDISLCVYIYIYIRADISVRF